MLPQNSGATGSGRAKAGLFLETRKVPPRPVASGGPRSSSAVSISGRATSVEARALCQKYGSDYHAKKAAEPRFSKEFASCYFRSEANRASV